MLKLPNKEVSLWRKAAASSKYPKLSGDLKVDVAIIGGGIAGLSAAYLLKQAGQTVAVIEKDRIGGGTSGHTTGKVTSQHNLIYKELADRLGERAARVYGQANQNALEQIAQIIKKERINCGFTRADNFVYTAEPKQVKKFQSEAKMAAKLGLPASFETSVDLPFPVLAAVKFKNQAYFNAQEYIDGLARAVSSGSSFVFENSRAGIIRGGKHPHIRSNCFHIDAKNIIVATNVPTLPLTARGTYCVLEYPHKSYIIACQAKDYPKGMYISPDDNHYSILPVTAGGKKYLLVGGSNHIPGTGLGSQRHYKELARYAESNLGATSIGYKWSARDYMAYDSLPLVGHLYPWSKNIYVVTAFRKWGMTNSMASAELLRDLITGRPNPAEELFDPHRPSVVSSIPHTIAKSFS